MRSRCARPDASSHCVNALMSAPAQNSAGLADASTIARAPRATSSSHAAARPSIVAGPSEFAGGLSIQTTATSPRTSSLTGP